MKLTDKIVLGAGVVPFILVIAAVLTVRSVLGDVVDRAETLNLSGEIVEQSYDIADVSKIEVSGGWEITISGGEEEEIVVSGDSALLETVRVSHRQEVLRLETDGIALHARGGLKADIILPNLRGITTRGGSDISLMNFDIGDLAIVNEGATNIEAQGVVTRNLSIDSDGAANIDFSQAEVYSAKINLDGAGSVELHMTGGELTGEIDGVGSVEYSGKVSRESVDVEGFGSVERTR